MHMKAYHFSMKTSKREEFIQITEKLNNILKKSEIQNGLMKIYLPHTTAAITINQNANPDVARDIIYILRNLIPHKRLLNVEGNSDAHFKSSLFGVNLEIPFDQNSLNLGDWQGVFLCEFDGPRTRNIRVQLWIPEI